MPTLLRLVAYAGVSAVLFLAAMGGDAWTEAHVVWREAETHDACRMFRLAGYLPTWLLIALGLGLVSWGRKQEHGWRRLLPALGLALSASLSGLAGETIKLLVRRQRPLLVHGCYVFRAWSDRTFSTSDLGLPSSHAVVAFGAAFMLVRLYPRGWPVWLLLALGCALTRLLEQAHYLSDVTLSAIVGFGVAWALAAAARKITPAPSTGV
jgi:membrane-associated phospholipid phosphatase